MKVLVTGARGQLAQSLAERSAAFPGIELIAVGRPELDLEQPRSVETIISSFAPGFVINAAAYTAVDEAEREPDRAFRLNAQAAGEEAVRSANPRHVIVRTAWVYSPFGKNFVKTMTAAALSLDRLRVVADQLGTPSSALDLADGLLRMIEAGPSFGQTYHLAGTGRTSWYGLAVAIMDECRKRGLPAAEVQPIASSDWPTLAQRPANSALNSCKFERDFGYSLPRWEDSLAQVIERLSQPR